MYLSPTQTDRAAGVLLGQAIGDALGVPYEFGSTRLDREAGPQMLGGGLGGYAPGEWSDDTQMAVCIARVTATGDDLNRTEALDRIADGFIDWYLDGPADIGAQTAHVLRAGLDHPEWSASEALVNAGYHLHERTGRTAGNGALMRTAVVGLTRLTDREATATAAARVAMLTHFDDLAGDSCVLWSEAVRRAVVDGVLDLEGGLDLLPEDRRDAWAARIREAEEQAPETFRQNGFTVTALQTAWSAVVHSGRAAEGPSHVVAALHRAIAVGHDTDTVAAIAGGLLGARYGVSSLPLDLQRRVHGWPGLRGRDLVRLAVLTARQGWDDAQGWPTAYREPSHPEPLAVPLVSDPDVILGTYADLSRTGDLGVDAVVSLCRIGPGDVAPGGVAPEDHVEVWLIDSDDPKNNAHLTHVLDDAARTVARLREDGRRVLLHCVAAHHRTPAVALRYLLARGADLAQARAEVDTALGRRVDGLLWKEAQR